MSVVFPMLSVLMEYAIVWMALIMKGAINQEVPMEKTSNALVMKKHTLMTMSVSITLFRYQ